MITPRNISVLLVWPALLVALPSTRAQSEGAIVTNRGAIVRGNVHGSVLALDGTAAVSVERGANLDGDLILPAEKNNGATMAGNSALAPGQAITPGVGLKLSPSAAVTVSDQTAVKGRQRIAKGFALPKPDHAKAPGGTAAVVLQNGREPDPDFKQLKDLTLRTVTPPGGLALPPRTLALPPGAYGTIAVESGQLLLGVAGSNERARYSFASLSVGAGAGVELLSPVVVSVDQLGAIDGLLGSRRYTQWLDLRVGAGAVNFGPGSEVHGVVTASNSAVTLSHGMKLRGGVVCDQATVEAEAQFTGVQPSWSSEATGNALPLFIHKAVRVEQRSVEMADQWADSFTVTVTYPEDVPNVELTAANAKVEAQQTPQAFFDACCLLFDATGFASGHLTVRHGGAPPTLSADLTGQRFEDALRTIGGRDPIRDGIRVVRNDPARLAAFMASMLSQVPHS